ncbi:MAG: D-alanyl-D-alanine carboxypeptidase family protein [Candidatus Faecousia sp.]|nr:D-alanyl-D-alanine carboxypeptidase family protein [Candidatus Faecousia sp.]
MMKRIPALLLAAVLAISLLPRRAFAVNLELNAKSALLMDVATGTVLFEKDCHERLAPASVTKVMTMLLIMEAVDSGKILLTDQVTASEAAAAKGGSQIYLKVGETMPVSDMLKSIAVSSANDCACAMAELLAGSESAFVEQMNKRAEELGMADTHFVNCTGLDDSPEAKDHRTSAYDIALMSRELLKNHPDIKKYTTIWMDTVRNGAFGLSNTNKLIRFYSGATGLKTGYTTGAGYCLSASAKREGMELIAVVMGCESSQKRSADCKTLLDYGYANYSVVRPGLKEGRTVAVHLGKEATVPVELVDRREILVDKAKRTSLSAKVELVQMVPAPVKKGQNLGTIKVYADEKMLIQLPLVAGAAVEKLSFWDVYKIVLRRVALAQSTA